MSRSDPLVIGFPVLSPEQSAKYGAADQGAQGRLILLQMTPIAHARPWMPPANCHVIAADQNDGLFQFTIPLKLWQELRQDLVYFREMPNPDRIGPSASIEAKTDGDKNVMIAPKR